jgi:lysozyme
VPIPNNLSKTVKSLVAVGASAIAIAGVLVTHFEGREYKPYRDATGIWTVCEGHTGPDVIPGKTYTDAQCDAFRDKDLAVAQAAVDRQVKVPLSSTQKAALIDFTYNVGAGNLARSTLLKKLNAGDYEGACAEYRQWRLAGGKVLPGLVLRREAEEWVCSLS